MVHGFIDDSISTEEQVVLCYIFSYEKAMYANMRPMTTWNWNVTDSECCQGQPF